MSVRQTLLRPVAYLAGLHASRQLRRFLACHADTRGVQDKLLAELLAAHAGTDFGRDHGLGRVRCYDDFRSAVPLGSYESLRPYMQRVLDGQTTALLPPGEEVLMFSMTSGTTGLPKHIPVTRRFLSDIRRGWNIYGLCALQAHKQAWLRPILQISSSMQESVSPTGKPCGAISGLLAATQKRIVRRMYVVPPQAASIADPIARYYAIVRCGIARDVAMIVTANPSSTIKLIETAQQHVDRLLGDLSDGTFNPPGGAPPELARSLRFKPNPALAKRLRQAAQRDGALLPRHFWNLGFLGNWTGGTLKLYLRRLRELFGPDVPLRDIGLLASEGRFSVPIADGTAAGVAEITGNFLEFIPADQRQAPSPDVARAHELQVGQEYFLVVSNWAGLWRYNMDDRIRVVDRYGQSPVFEFLCRGLRTANITGEKLTEHQVVEAMRRAAAETGAAIDRFVLQGRFADTPYYELRMERPGPEPADRLAEALDASLRGINMEYRSKREGGRLGPIRAVLLPAGALDQAEREHIRSHRGRADQYKHQYLMTDVMES